MQVSEFVIQNLYQFLFIKIYNNYINVIVFHTMLPKKIFNPFVIIKEAPFVLIFPCKISSKFSSNHNFH